MLNLLVTKSIRVITGSGSEALLTLPGVFAKLACDDVAAFPSLRAHQRHAWHAFLSQLAALAMLRADQARLWTDTESWRDALRALTADHPDDAPWSLVTPPDRPALLQPPLPDGLAGLRNVIATPDELDVLVTSRNHDLKIAVMTTAASDDWLFALVTLQTMEGFLGAGNYGISRMNGGFANRPALGVAPPGGLGAHVARDVTRLLAVRNSLSTTEQANDANGKALLWLEPWDGTASLRPEALDPLYIEICRRVRIVEAGGQLAARAGSSKVPRVAPTGGGLTGDPWAPMVDGNDGRKVLSLDGTGFHYRRMVKLMWPGHNNASPLQSVVDTDAKEGLTLVARALVRGQGKTEGYHERRVPLSRRIRQRLGREDVTDPIAEAAQRRVELAGQVGRVLRSALLTLFQGGPERVDERDKDGARKAQSFLNRFEAYVDRDFFDDLMREAETSDADAAHIERKRWVGKLRDLAEGILDAADHAAPKAIRRRLRARVRAQGALHGLFRHNELLRAYLTEKVADAS